MRLIQRISCFSLAVFLLLSFPLTSLASSGAVPAPSPSVADYIFDTLLAANGVEAPLSSVGSWLGSWVGYDDYLEQGAKGELGAYSQWLYDIQHSDMAEEARESARQQIETVTGWMEMDWSDVAGKQVSIDGILNGWVQGGHTDASLASTSVKGFLKTFSSYGTGALDYLKRPITHEYPVDGWTKPSDFGGHIISFTGPHFSSNSKNTAKDFYYTSGFSSSAYQHRPYAVLSRYLPDSGKWSVLFYYASASPGSIGKVYPLTIKTHSVDYDRATGQVTDERTGEIRGASGEQLSASVIHSLPFPVFTTKAAGDAYAQSAVMEGIYNQLAQGLPVTGVNQDAQTMDAKVVPIVITLPDTGEKAAELLAQLQDAMGRIEELEAALKNAGLDIGWDIDVPVPTVAPTDAEIPGEDTGKVTLSDIIAKVEAVPAAVTAMLEKKLEPEDIGQDTSDLKLPVSIADKFPFCIPYDIAYLVRSLSSASEVPRFELPFKIHYLGFNYENLFIVDMSDWDPAVRILRTMLDLLFIAGLITVTRDLIRG